jgi:hypothetical protein
VVPRVPPELRLAKAVLQSRPAARRQHRCGEHEGAGAGAASHPAGWLPLLVSVQLTTLAPLFVQMSLILDGFNWVFLGKADNGGSACSARPARLAKCLNIFVDIISRQVGG